MTAAAIELRRLTVRYGSFRAVDALDLEVRRGELFGFLGPNGAGKTTTIRVLVGGLRPSSGEVRVAGCELPRDFDRVRSLFGYVPDTENHFEDLTGLENLRFFARLYGLPRVRADDALARLELDEAGSLPVRGYSKGMKRKLLIAREILHRPQILYCDEPTANLDAHSTERVRELLRKLSDEGTTVFLTTHDMDEVEAVCDRVALLCRGRLVACDTPANFVATHAERRVAVHYDRGGSARRELLDLDRPDERKRAAELLATEDPVRVHSVEFDFADVFRKLTGQAYD